MIGGSARRWPLAGALTLLALAAAGSAQAAVTATAISSPAANSYFSYDADAFSTTLFTVTGTTTGSGNVDINCYDGNGNLYHLVTNVDAASTAFSVPVTTAEVDTVALTGRTCALRAVPTGDVTDYAPGGTSAFPGPDIAITERDTSTTPGGLTYDFGFRVSDFSGAIDLFSAGDCGLDYGSLYASTTLTPSPSSFNCMGALFDTYNAQNGSVVGPEIEVDGSEALDASSADNLVPGFQGIAPAESFNNGALTVNDNEPLMLCTPNCTSPTAYTSAGVELNRTWQVLADGLEVIQIDSFASTDGREHALSVLEDEHVTPPSGATASFDFPGSSGFQDYGDTATITLPAGAGKTYFKVDQATPDTGDGTNPQGAIVYSSAPSGPVRFTYSDEPGGYGVSRWVMPYARTIPAGGSALVRFAYVQAYSLSQVQSLATRAVMAFRPRVLISSPVNGATVTTPTITVSGTVTDPAGITGMTINTRPATLVGSNAFTGTVTLVPGANTITAAATDTDGLGGDRVITVTYQDPPAVTTGAASKMKATSVIVAGTVNPEQQSTTYQVQYGTSAGYGSTSRAGSIGSGSTSVAVSRTLTGLKPTTTYHYRIVATNASGTTDGPDRTFRTAKPSPAGLGAKVVPKKATRSPFRFTVEGKLSLPPGIAKKKGCSGRITIKVAHGRRAIATRQAKITRRCTWKRVISLRIAGHGRLEITPSFHGNSALAALTARPLTARYA